MKRFLPVLLPRLLPRDAREHVLGDLEERCLSLRDIASVFPLVWWSYLLRAWRTPSILAAGTPEVTVRRRFEHRNLLRNILLLIPLDVVIILRFVFADDQRRLINFRATMLVALLLPVSLGAAIFGIYRKRRPPAWPTRDAWLARLGPRQEVLILVPIITGATMCGVPALAWAPLAFTWFVLGWLNARQVRREMSDLPSEVKE